MVAGQHGDDRDVGDADRAEAQEQGVERAVGGGLGGQRGRGLLIFESIQCSYPRPLEEATAGGSSCRSIWEVNL